MNWLVHMPRLLTCIQDVHSLSLGWKNGHSKISVSLAINLAGQNLETASCHVMGMVGVVKYHWLDNFSKHTEYTVIMFTIWSGLIQVLIFYANIEAFTLLKRSVENIRPPNWFTVWIKLQVPFASHHSHHHCKCEVVPVLN
jgi:hypothetical protein